jgi:RimJ/RimL family protein N-acetyltransferase
VPEGTQAGAPKAPTQGFDYQPTLRGLLLQLRPLREDDFGDLFAVASDPRLWEGHPERTRYQAAVFAAFFREALASGGALVAADADSGLIIGSSRYHDYRADRSEVEIGWSFLARSHWRGRYNGEMKALMLRHAFRFVSAVVFLVDPGNLRSQRALQKIGAVPQGRRRDHLQRDRLCFRIAAAEWDQIAGHAEAAHEVSP